MSLAESYTVKTSAIPDYFAAILGARPPERFSIKFLENLGFTGTNDRLIIGILKDLGFLDADGVPTQRYYNFLDRSRSGQVLAEAIREAYSDLFAVKTNAHELSADEIKNKLRTLYAGSKSENVIARIAKTFEALCQEADFSQPVGAAEVSVEERPETKKEEKEVQSTVIQKGRIHITGLQYHINIILPESRDQAVYDAIFKSLREHLG